MFAWVLLFRKWPVTFLIGTYIFRVLVIDGYLYSRVYGNIVWVENKAGKSLSQPVCNILAASFPDKKMDWE